MKRWKRWNHVDNAFPRSKNETNPSQTGTNRKKETLQANDNQQAENRHRIGGFTGNNRVMPFNQLNPSHESAPGNGQFPIHQKLKRILQLDNENSWSANPEESSSMITKIIIRPNPFETFIALEIECVQSKHLIIRMTDLHDRIVKMFSWFVVKGANVTSFNEMDSLEAGNYCLDVMDLEGELLFSTDLIKK